MIVNKKIHGYIKAIGIPFFKYVLDINEEIANQLFSKDVELGESKEKLFFDLCEEIGELRKRFFKNDNINFDLYRVLKEHLVEGKYHIMNVWRSQVSIVTEPPIVKDAILQKLLKLGTEVFPSTLIKDPFFDEDMIFISYIRSHILTKEIEVDLMESEVIRNLYQECNVEDRKVFLHMWSSAGSGGAFNSDSLIQYILSNAIYLMKMYGQNNIMAYYNSIIEVYNKTCECLSEKRATVPYMIGFSNINLEDIKEIDFGTMKIKRYDEELLSILPKSIRPGKGTKDGKAFISGFVLVGEYDYVIKVGANSENGFPAYEEERLKINHVIEKVKLAISISQDREKPVSVVQNWSMLFAPLSHGHGCSYNPSRITPTTLHSIQSKDQVENIKYWYDKISHTNYQKIKIAINRTVNAISQRNDPVDGFLDGIIAIENIFGTISELSFRISMAVAFLLGKNPEERKTYQKKINDLYKIRSKYVHGSILLEWNDAINHRDQTINILLACLRKLFENPKYLESSNENRAKQIMLSLE